MKEITNKISGDIMGIVLREMKTYLDNLKWEKEEGEKEKKGEKTDQSQRSMINSAGGFGRKKKKWPKWRLLLLFSFKNLPSSPSFLFNRHVLPTWKPPVLLLPQNPHQAQKSGQRLWRPNSSPFRSLWGSNVLPKMSDFHAGVDDGEFSEQYVTSQTNVGQKGGGKEDLSGQGMLTWIPPYCLCDIRRNKKGIPPHPSRLILPCTTNGRK